ncbi:MAG: hypothetical protein WAN33_10185 [Candidatus Acidiferrales bacterium]
MTLIWTKLAARLRIRTRYTRALEEEVVRLRAENRALVNSILGVAGIPPMRAAVVHAPRRSSFTVASGGAEPASPQFESPVKDVGVTSSAPLRRRSWQQIGRVLEIEDARAARREREADTETFPTPRRVVPRL